MTVMASLQKLIKQMCPGHVSHSMQWKYTYSHLRKGATFIFLT